MNNEVSYRNEKKEPEKGRSEDISDKYDIKSQMLKVETKVAKAMTADVIKAHIPEEKRMEIVEMISNAYHARAMQETMARNAYEWTYDEKTHTWTNKRDEKTFKQIMKDAETTFNMFIVKMEAYALLQRNDSRNWLLKVLNDTKEEEEDEEEQKNWIAKAKELFKPNEQTP